MFDSGVLMNREIQPFYSRWVIEGVLVFKAAVFRTVEHNLLHRDRTEYIVRDKHGNLFNTGLCETGHPLGAGPVLVGKQNRS